MRQFVIITGMHRSGTSMISGLLERSGVHFGDKFIKAHPPDNPKGYYEDADFVSINRQILRESDGNWHQPPKKIIENKMIKRRIASFIRKWPKNGFIGLKDPRCCLTLGLWKKYIKDMKVIFVTRNNQEILNSLKKRNGFSDDKIKKLYKHYYVSFSNIAKKDYFTIDYNKTLLDPKLEMLKLINYIGLKDNKLTDVKIKEYVDLKLYRQKAESREGGRIS